MPESGTAFRAARSLPAPSTRPSPLDGELRRDGPVVALGRQPDLPDPADCTVVAEALTAVDLRIDHEEPAAEPAHQLADVQLERLLHGLPFREGDGLVAVLPQGPVADVAEPNRLVGQDDPL